MTHDETMLTIKIVVAWQYMPSDEAVSAVKRIAYYDPSTYSWYRLLHVAPDTVESFTETINSAIALAVDHKAYVNLQPYDPEAKPETIAPD